MRLSRRALLVAGTAMIGYPALGRANRLLYRDEAAPLAMRVKDLLGRMTLEEKAAQLCCLWSGKSRIMVPSTGVFDEAKAKMAIPDGIGQIARPSDMFGTNKSVSEPFRDPADAIAFINDVQRFCVEHTRLGIPALFHEETAHGLMVKGATSFPIPTGLGSSFDPDLVEQVFTLVARQARMRGITVGLSPVVDLIRDPRWGRSEEFFGEDPYHVSVMGLAAVRGLQGRSRPIGPDRVFATLKHFVHGTPQGGINVAPADMSERTLRAVYLPSFAKAVAVGHAAIVMPSYNEVAGVPAHADRTLLQGVGRGLLNFQGVYMSDYGAIDRLVTDHRIATDKEEAAVLAMKAGVDIDLPEGANYVHLPALVRAGKIPLESIDAAVARVLALKIEAGLFETPYVDAKRATQVLADPAGRVLARRAAQRSIVLLKNDGILPLATEKPMKLALIGPNSVTPRLGGYSRAPQADVGIWDGLKAALGQAVTLEQADGVWLTQKSSVQRPEIIPLRPVSSADNAVRIAEAVEVAKRSDVIILAVGDNEQITREAVAAALPGDRRSIGLFGDQDALIEALLAIGKPIIAILVNGRPLAVTRLAEQASALLEGWYLGEQGGHAIADVLFGRVNPGGKLSVSIPRDVGELPAFYDRHPSADLYPYVEGRRQPLFPFGHGLSYTSFELSSPRLSADRIAQDGRVRIEVDVANVGDREGDEVVQLYIRDERSSVPRPILELKGFRRVSLAKGQRTTISFELGPDELGFWDIDMRWSVETGSFRISTGASSAALKDAMLTVA